MEILHRAEFQQGTKTNVFDYYVNRIIVKAMAWIRGLFDSQTMRDNVASNPHRYEVP